MKFKVGDKVKVVQTDIGWGSNLQIGEVHYISKAYIYDNPHSEWHNKPLYQLEDESGWNFPEHWFEKAVKQRNLPEWF